MLTTIKPYWIKVLKTVQINKIKTRIFLSEEDYIDTLSLKGDAFGTPVDNVKICQVECYLFQKGKSLYLLEKEIANRDWGGINYEILS